MRKITLLLLVCIAMLSARAFDITPEQKLSATAAIIQRYYVEEVGIDSIVDEAIIAMLKTLDPHSAYSTPSETEELNQPLEGKFSGIGIQFNMVEDTVYVIQTTPGGPCEKVGVLPGDRIISANDTVIAGKKMVNTDVVKVLRGPKGSVVNLKVKRRDEVLDFEVTRDDIPIYSVDAAYMVDGEVGYISVSRFAEATDREVVQAADSLSRLGMKHLILDLASNGGGYLGSAAKLGTEFLRYNDPIVLTKGLNSPESQFNAQYDGTIKVDRVVVIVDQYSASAAEILAGAIQDNDRGLVVGRCTFRTGPAQRPYPFADGSMVRLTTARYYTPSGRCIQKPYEKGKGEEYQLDLLNRYNSGELWHADSVKLDTTQRFFTLRNKRVVYGGGGIMPDLFVPADTSFYSRYYRDLVAKGSVIKFALKYVENHRDSLLSKYPTEEVFAEKFKVDEQMTAALIERGKVDKVEYVEEQWNTSRPIIEATLKGLLLRDLYEDGIYVRATNPLNPDFLAALSLIRDPERYDALLRGQ